MASVRKFKAIQRKRNVGSRRDKIRSILKSQGRGKKASPFKNRREKLARIS